MLVRDEAAKLAGEIAELRHAIHREPEIGLDLPKTQRKVLDALAGLPLEVSTGTAVSSVTAVLRGGRPGPVVLLRGDMDALPVTEETGLPYASAIPGAMHACGHDLHTAMLAGAAKLLSARQAEVPGTVIFMFQPGEEGYAGARYMINEGVLDAAGERPVAAYALHVSGNKLPCGMFSTRPGPMLAAADQITVTVHGRGGHASQPHRAADPIPAACEMVIALQTMVTRKFDVFDPVVITVGSFHAGTTDNVIPDQARFLATARSYSAASRTALADLVPRLITDIADAHGLTADAEYAAEYPVTVNDATEAAFAGQVITEVFGPDRGETAKFPITGAEDFSFVLEEVPGAFIFLGACPPDRDPETAPTNHSAIALFDDSVLAEGTALYAELALRRLAQGRLRARADTAFTRGRPARPGVGHNLSVSAGSVASGVGVSAREAEVLAALGEHLTNAEIAARLFISVRTVESHVSSLLRKLQVNDRRALAAAAATLRAGAASAAARGGPAAALAADLVRRPGRRTGRAGRGARGAPAGDRGRPGRGRQDPAGAERGHRGGRAVRRRRLVRRSRAGHRSGAWSRRPSRPRSASASARAGRPRTPCSAGWRRGRRCWSWTTASTCWTGCRCCSSGCSRAARGCRCWSPAGPGCWCRSSGCSRCPGLSIAAGDGGPGDAVELFLSARRRGRERADGGGRPAPGRGHLPGPRRRGAGDRADRRPRPVARPGRARGRAGRPDAPADRRAAGSTTGTVRCGPRWTGATPCWTRPTGRCCAGSRCSRPRSPRPRRQAMLAGWPPAAATARSRPRWPGSPTRACWSPSRTRTEPATAPWRPIRQYGAAQLDRGGRG